jgi:type VI secretion system protein ImpK
MNTEAKEMNYFMPVELIKLTANFYGLIAEIKNLENRELEQSVKLQLDLNATPKPEEISVAVQLRLHHWLEKARQFYADKLSARENEYLDEAIYAMAALADEIFLINYDWQGRPHWQNILLEQSLFRSCSAGSSIFTRINKLLLSRSHNKMERELCGVYLLILRLGFYGMYRDDTEGLVDYRQQLYRLIGREPKTQQNPIFSEAYERLMTSKEPQRLAPLSAWLRLTRNAIVFYLLFSTGIWFYLSWKIPEPSCESITQSSNVEHVQC